MPEVRAPVPVAVSRFGLHAALREEDALVAVAAALLGSGNPLVVLGWKEMHEIRRDSAIVAEIADELEWTEDQVDDLFRRAARIVV